MAKFGCPPRFIAMVQQFHDGMQARVQNDGEFSEPFEVTNWLKQGCVMAPTLLSMMFSAMLMDAFQDSDTAFSIRYRFDGNIFNLRRLLAKTKKQTYLFCFKSWCIKFLCSWRLMYVFIFLVKFR